MTKQQRARRPHEMAFIGDEPCPACGGEWMRPTVRVTDDDIMFGVACANVDCRRQIKAPAEGAA